MPAVNACCHCDLPVGRLGQQRDVLGEPRWFCCYGCNLAWQVEHGSADAPEAAKQLIRLGVGGFLAMNVMLLSWLLYAGSFRGDDAWLLAPVLVLLWLLATPLLVLLGAPFFAGAWRSLREGRPNADTLVAVGVFAAYLYSCLQVQRGSDQVYFDTAAMVLLLFTLGRYLEAQGRARAARCLAPMLAAERAAVHRVAADGREQLVAAREIRLGERVRVRPGERVAIDGIVVDGRSETDDSALTGQAVPQAKAAGSFVHAGCLNGRGTLLVRATTAGADSRWMHIGRSVRAALAAKSLRSDSIDRAAAAFVPFVLLLALATAMFWSTRGEPGAALLAGLAVLVVACPCSLGLASALAATLAIANAARRGILVRSAAALETLARVRGIAFDKTGTLTHETLRAVSLVVADTPADLTLRRAGTLARGSAHPIARAVAALAAAAGDADTAATAADLMAEPGAGLTGSVDGVRCTLGSAAFLVAQGNTLPPALADDGGSGLAQVWIGWQGQARARLQFGAPLTADAAAVVAACRARGLPTLLLSGDGAAAVAAAAAQLGLDDWRAGMTPEAKVAALRGWRERLHGPVVMVGDGLNDGPVLAAAGVGIAVGDAAAGASDLARESADIVLPPGALGELPWLLDLAAQQRRSVRANLAWAFGYNAVALALAASALLQPAIAAALMAGSTLVVATRSWRASRRELGAASAPPQAATALRWSPR